MNTNFLTIIKRIVSEQGESILANPQQLKGLISDYAKDEPKPERLAFGRCIEYGAYTELKNAPPGGRAAVKNRLAQRLHSGEGLDPALCAEALDLLEAALFGTLSAAGQNTAPPPSYPSSAPVPASSAYQPSQPPAYQPSAPAARISYQVKMRGLASYIIFGILTLGIYQLYWYYKLAKDVNLICAGDLKKTGGLAKQIFFGILTLGIYNLVWLYMLGDRLYENAPRYNLAFKEAGGTVFAWWFFGSLIIIGPFISLYIIIKNTNALAMRYNQGVV